MLPAAAIKALVLFALGLFLRVAFWLATPDHTGLHAIAYQGDAPVWQRYAAGPGDDVEWALPFRPPGMAWLADLLTDGNDATAWWPRLCMVLLGALVAPLVYLGVRRGFSERPALIAGGLCACSSGLMLLGNGLHSEIPYLLLFLVSIFDFERMQNHSSAGVAGVAAVRWALLQTTACLFRADHLLFVVLSLAWLRMRRRPCWLQHGTIVTATMIVALLPWQWHANHQVARANAEGFPGRTPPTLPWPGSLPWNDDAMAAVAAMPAFARAATFGFVDATMRVRGAQRVTATDLRVLEEAYGYRPEPLTTPLLALYGPLNFFCANSDESTGGFSRTPLERRPPLHGGLDRYPRGLVLPNDLAFDYPPHLEAINHGYRLGLQWIAAHPQRAAELLVAKLAISWRGAATGFSGYALPMGLSGVREPVDLVVAEGPIATAWRVVLLLLALLGLWYARQQAAATPWLLWLLGKGITVALFFGYARLGALCVPSLAVLWTLVLDRWVCDRLSPIWRRRLWFGCVVLALGIESCRWLSAPVPHLENARPNLPSGAVTYDQVRIRY